MYTGPGLVVHTERVISCWGFRNIFSIIKRICFWFMIQFLDGFQNPHSKPTVFSRQEQRLKELSKRPSTSSTTAASPVSTASGSISTAPAIDLFSTPSSTNRWVKCWEVCSISPQLCSEIYMLLDLDQSFLFFKHAYIKLYSHARITLNFKVLDV